MRTDLKYGQRVKRRAFTGHRVVYRGDTAYALVPPRRPGWSAVVYEFTRVGSKFRLDAIGRVDHTNYAGLFPEEAAPQGEERTP